MNNGLEALILSLVGEHWQKVAMVIAKVLDAENKVSKKNTPEATATKIKDLVRSGQLEGRGDLSEWRHSEVRICNSEKRYSDV